MSTPADLLHEHGGILRLARLVELGCTADEVRAAVGAGELRAIRKGWYATSAAPHDVVRAVRVGGTATATTVARLHGLWEHGDDRLHVRVRYSTGRLSSPDDRRVPLDRDRDRVCVHYSRIGGLDLPRDPLTLALAEMFACTDDTAALAAVDSALERGVLQMGHLDLVRERMPSSRRCLLDRVDPECQSGLETRVRLLLRSLRVAFRSQAYLAGIGRVDFLVGDRLVIEVDGRAFHTGDAFVEDRRRDFELVTRGYLVLRLSSQQVLHDWERTRAGIVALLARGGHRWGAARGPFAPELPATAILAGSDATDAGA